MVLFIFTGVTFRVFDIICFWLALKALHIGQFSWWMCCRNEIWNEVLSLKSSNFSKSYPNPLKLCTCREASQQTFQRRFNVAFRLIWRRDVAQRQINVETTLSTSTLKSTTFNNVELNNVRQRRKNVVVFNVDFHNVGQCRNNVADMTISKKQTNKPRFKSKIIFLKFKEYVGLKIFFSFSSF